MKTFSSRQITWWGTHQSLTSMLMLKYVGYAYVGLEFFPHAKSYVRDTRVFNQYYSYTIYVWLWYKLTFLIAITVHNVFKNTLTFSCLQYFEQIRFVILNFLLQKTWRNIQSCSTIIFLFATFSNILKYKYICNCKVNYYITCHWILEIYYFFL